MIRNLLILFCFSMLSTVVIAQQPAKTKEQLELEKERQQLKKEIEQAQQSLDKVKKSTKENLTVYAIYNNKLNLQEKVVNNINREINILDNNIVKSQRDVRKLTLLLDTLKQEYAKSMVYSYKNRSNSDFLNFIFSSSSFNDAIKRVAYLRSYRSYREMQGENILRTQNLLKGRVSELNQTKQQKGTVLETQNKEKEELADQQQQQKKVVENLKAQAKELNSQLAAKKKQEQKVGKAIAAAIKRAQDEAIKEAARAAAAAAAAAKADAAKNASNTAGTKPAAPRPPKPAPVKRESVLLGDAEAVKLNTNFENNRGHLPWPVDRGYVTAHFGRQKIEGSNIEVDNAGITLGGDIGTPVKVVFDGEVVSITNIDDMQVVIIKHGRYFSSYSNLSGVNLTKGQDVHTGQVIGRMAANFDGVGAIDLYISNEKGNLNPEQWLRHR